jgi:malate synthase
MCRRAEVAGQGRAAPAILGLAFLSSICACGGLAGAQAQTPNQIREQALQMQQQIRQRIQQQSRQIQQQASQTQQQAFKIQQQILHFASALHLTRIFLANLDAVLLQSSYAWNSDRNSTV